MSAATSAEFEMMLERIACPTGAARRDASPAYARELARFAEVLRELAHLHAWQVHRGLLTSDQALHLNVRAVDDVLEALAVVLPELAMSSEILTLWSWDRVEEGCRIARASASRRGEHPNA